MTNIDYSKFPQWTEEERQELIHDLEVEFGLT